jgi:hypothetical protein
MSKEKFSHINLSINNHSSGTGDGDIDRGEKAIAMGYPSPGVYHARPYNV